MKSIDCDLSEGDIIRSHRVGNPNRNVPSRGPRQVIVRVKDTTTKRRILKASKDLKDGDKYTNILINEDLTRTRNSLAYRAR